MKLNDLKREEKEYDCMPCCGSDGAYPYGLVLHLDEDTCEKLGLGKALKPGTRVSIQAMGVVTHSSESLDRDDKGTDVCLTVQIMEMGAQPAGAMSNAADVLYPKS